MFGILKAGILNLELIDLDKLELFLDSEVVVLLGVLKWLIIKKKKNVELIGLAETKSFKWCLWISNFNR
jgi:hypothetical protein